MQKPIIIRRVLTAAVLLLAPFALSAQEGQKEIHIKIIENGVVTKDTVYTQTGPSGEVEHFEEFEGQLSKKENAERKYVTEENRKYVVRENPEKDFERIEKGGRQQEVRVIVHEDGGLPGNRVVEEIWIGKSAEEGPCRTIIIHEGDCPGKDIEKVMIREGQGPVPPVPPMTGEKPVKIEKKIIKTENGEKVIITETIVNDKKSDSKKDKKKE